MKRHHFKPIFFCLFLSLTFSLTAQNVGINDDNSSPDANAMLDVKSSTKGVLFPRMTTAQRFALGNLNPTPGMLVFDTDLEEFFYATSIGECDGACWVPLITPPQVPTGTILAFGGSTAPPGYLICDGNPVNSISFPALYAAIGTRWGGNGAPNFNLPDLRGRFPRGWDNGAGNDPDAGSRTALHNGGQTGDSVGSYQSHALEQHTHTYTRRSTTFTADDGGTNVWRIDASYQSSGVNGATVSDNETRPKNANVLYIIKY
jgi:microcystin-dependent protein